MKTNHHSYGIIPIYKKDKEIFICCVHNEKSDEWGLPKGTPEGNETPFETAKRELEEETGITNFEIFGGKTFLEEYSFEQDGMLHHKQNTYYLGLVNEMKEKSPDIDSKDMRWISVKEADNFFKFENIKEIIRDLVNYVNKFPLTKIYKGYSNTDYLFEYFEANSFGHLPQDAIKQSYAIAFHGDKFIVVNNISKPGSYTPVGGSVEPGENPNDTLIREVQEESNMKVLDYKLLGYQKVTDMSGIEKPYYQLRYVAKVEPYGPFVSDPAGKVTEIIYCDENDYKKYFDWFEIGDEIIRRAVELKNKFATKTL